ncbi:hypothetical protein HV213_26655 [Klebsiella sp. RHBSTW-00484]|nr:MULTISPECIES: hypothetical protein [Enterobacteriaceae]EJN1473333.1 hypothetical protein [Citrobacter freundii]HCP9988375.1 hypothetical protein [Escherichia coli]AZL63548.1 hypothetical protein EI562_11385 [Enterobacter asburiae]MCK1021227.1 hypothetical protein [Enterobacter hormaechei subsp. xiangfangensis]MCL8192275.1 hypothetical protein [Enterobacter cloacae]
MKRNIQMKKFSVTAVLILNGMLSSGAMATSFLPETCSDMDISVRTDYVNHEDVSHVFDCQPVI